jgi:uncharacterized protein
MIRMTSGAVRNVACGMRNKKLRRPSGVTQRYAGLEGGAPLACTAALVLLALITGGCKEKGSPPESPDKAQHLPTVTIQVGGQPLAVEVARTEAQRRIGMMFRSSLGPDEAMLFVFDRAANLAFWMANTAVDLDLAYIQPDGEITQIEHMKAYDTDQVVSREPARYVLEAPAGWFAAHKIDVGARVVIPPEAAGK